MDIETDRVLMAFAEYARGYDTDDPKIALKIEHTYKVAELCGRIAQSECADASLTDLAWLAGMLHDLGRFEQIARYGTFADANSVSHALLSTQILFDEEQIEKFVEVGDKDAPEFSMLRTAIGEHSAWELPGNLDQGTCMLCNVLRDADKLDIMRVNCSFPVEVIYPFTEDELNVSALSLEAIAAFDRHETIPTQEKRLPADFALGHCSFGWGLVFQESRCIALEQGYLRRLFGRPYELPATRRTFARAEKDMFSWLETDEA